MHQDDIYNAFFLPGNAALLVMCKRNHLEQTAVLMQDKCSQTVSTKTATVLSGSWLCAGLCVCQLALKSTIHALSHTHTHAWDESVYHIVLFAPILRHRCVSVSPHTHTKGNILRHKYWINSAEKKGGRQIAKRKRTAEREMASCLT